MKHKLRVLSLICTLVGAFIWISSPYIFGASEPWDSPYFGRVNVLLFIIGLGFGFAGYEKPILWPLGILTGSFLYGLFTFIKDIFFYSGGGVNMFIPLGIIFLIPLCLPVFVGSFGGSFLRKRYSRA